MTLGELKELIEDLERLEGDHVLNMDVYTEYDYGDHGHTRALTVFNNVQVINPYETAYSDSGLAVTQDEDRITKNEAVVVLVRR